MKFEKNETDIKNMFTKEKSARAMYSEKIRKNEETSSDFYNESK
jgi:hypothetical protein